MAASEEQNPLKMAVISYNAYRDSPLAANVHKIDKKAYDAYALDAILRMAKILERMKWDPENIKEFLVKSKELAGIE